MDRRNIDENATFLDGEQVDGIHLVTDPILVAQLKNFLCKCAGGYKSKFPVMWSVHLKPRNILELETRPHFVIPKPHGTRYLLYVDPSGQIYLENYAQNIFRIDEDHSVKFISSDGQSITDTILDGVITRVADKRRPDAGRLTFVIMDAILCRGVSLRQMNIKQRIAFVRDEIMQPRLNNPSIIHDNEVFNLDIVECKESYEAEDFMTQEFRNDIFKYSLFSIIFIPRDKVYTCGTCPSVYQWVENDDCRGVFLLKIPKTWRNNNFDQKIGELYVSGPWPNDTTAKFDDIQLTDELRKLDGRIIDCIYVDNQWVFQKLRNDRKHPNVRQAAENSLEIMRDPITRTRLLKSLEIARDKANTQISSKFLGDRFFKKVRPFRIYPIID